MRRIFRKEFRLPLLVGACAATGLIIPTMYANYVLEAAVFIGIASVMWDSVKKVREGRYSLDYIAFLAMIVALFSEQYFAGAVIALMITGGEALDAYASSRAESALRALVDSIPKTCLVRTETGLTEEKPIQEVRAGDRIIVKRSELIPLDGTLVSESADINVANLTGESVPVELMAGAFIKSGSINLGGLLEIRVEGTLETSTYMRIVHLVDDAKKHQAPVVRLAETINFPFTVVTLLLAGAAYAMSGEMWRALAVLVIATPCPLIIAAPVAFIGGMSRAARANIIVKKPATLEELTHARTIFFDKTGTLTFGEPELVKIKRMKTELAEDEILSIAASIEFHSIHPLARTIVSAHSKRGIPQLDAQDVTETIGTGIEGTVRGHRYTIGKSPILEGNISLSIFENNEEIARMVFKDHMKDDVPDLFADLKKRRISSEILTGDTTKNAENLFGRFGIPIHAEQTPETKFAAIDAIKNDGGVVAMVGDGLNDAPALARADVGIVFSGTEHSAAMEAAHIVILGRDLHLVEELFDIATRAMRIARQSIWGGVLLSSLGMLIAAMGFIPPVWGAVLQEIIDIAVILNSLRAARS